MPNHKSAEKRVRQTERRTIRNRQIKGRFRSAVKDVWNAVESKGGPADITPLVEEAVREVYKAAAKGVIHKQNAARRVSRLMQLRERYHAQQQGAQK